MFESLILLIQLALCTPSGLDSMQTPPSLEARSPNIRERFRKRPLCQVYYHVLHKSHDFDSPDEFSVVDEFVVKLVLPPTRSWDVIPYPSVVQALQLGCPDFRLMSWTSNGGSPRTILVDLQPPGVPRAQELDRTKLDPYMIQCILDALQTFACRVRAEPPVECVSTLLSDAAGVLLGGLLTLRSLLCRLVCGS